MCEYSVDFDNDMTMKYLDERGQLKFAFEIVSTGGVDSLRLYGNPLTVDYRDVPPSDAEPARIERAVRRTVDYMVKCGHKVCLA